MISIKRYDKVEPILLAFDYKSNSRHNFYHVDEVNYLLAKLNFEQGDYINCQDYLRRVLKDEHVHHDAYVLMAALHFKNKDLVSQAESEAWLLSAL